MSSSFGRRAAAILMMAAVAGCGSFPVTPPLSEGAILTVAAAQNGGQARMTPGDQLAIYLGTNPSTGYAWQVIRDGAPQMAYLGSQIVSPPSAGAAKVGASRTAIFRFRALTAGATTIELQYRRAWEKQALAAPRYVLNVTVW